MRLLFSIFAGVLLCGDLLAQRDPARLTDGPMLGHVTSDSIRIWGRTSDPSEFQVRYGFIRASLNSLADNIPAEMVGGLLEVGLWQPASLPSPASSRS